MVSWSYRTKDNFSLYGDENGWSHPITLNIYSITGTTTLGTKIGTITTTFTIPWRPEPSAACGDTRWQFIEGESGTNCANGQAMHFTFDLKPLNITAPDEIVWGIAYNTRTWGYNKINIQGPYDSFNIATDGIPSVGTDVVPAAQWRYHQQTGSQGYCDSGTAGTTPGINVFRYDGDCRSGFVPNIAFRAWNE